MLDAPFQSIFHAIEPSVTWRMQSRRRWHQASTTSPLVGLIFGRWANPPTPTTTGDMTNIFAARDSLFRRCHRWTAQRGRRSCENSGRRRKARSLKEAVKLFLWPSSRKHNSYGCASSPIPVRNNQSPCKHRHILTFIPWATVPQSHRLSTIGSFDDKAIIRKHVRAAKTKKSPSSGATPSAFPYTQASDPTLNGRPFVTCSTPVHLYHNVFTTFTSVCNDNARKIPLDIQKHIFQLCHASSELYETISRKNLGETRRLDAVLPIWARAWESPSPRRTGWACAYARKQHIVHVKNKAHMWQNLRFFGASRVKNLKSQISNDLFFKWSETQISPSEVQIPNVSGVISDSDDTFQNVIWDSDASFESQMTVFKMSFEIQMPHLSLKWHFSKCCLRFRYLIWDSNDTFQNVIWDSDASFESQMTLFKMSFEIQMPHLSLKWHFSKCHLRFRCLIWVSNDTFQNVIWDSDASFETQMTFFKMSFEIQIPHLSLKWHFSKCHLRFRYLIWVSNDIFQNVIWDSDTSFESQMTLFKMSFEIQIPPLRLKWHFSKCHLRFRYLIWVSNDTFQNVIWDSDTSFETQMTLFKMSFEIQIPHLSLKWHFSKCHLRFRCTHLSLKWHF